MAQFPLCGSVAFCSPAKSLTFRGLMENPLRWQKANVLTSKQNATKVGKMTHHGGIVPSFTQLQRNPAILRSGKSAEDMTEGAHERQAAPASLGSLFFAPGRNKIWVYLLYPYAWLQRETNSTTTVAGGRLTKKSAPLCSDCG